MHGRGKNQKSKAERRLRQEKFNAQGGLCHWCKQPMQMNPIRRGPNGDLKDNPLYASFEHVVPKSMGGARSRGSNNVVLAHVGCNNKRHRRNFENDPVYGPSLGEVAERFKALVLKTSVG